MDEDAIELVKLLCTRAGMMMEDASAAAVTIGSDPLQLPARVARLLTDADGIRTLLLAADALAKDPIQHHA